MTAHGDTRKFLGALRAQGFTVSRTGRQHWAIDAPDGRRIGYWGSSPSDWRGLRNLRARLRRAGAVL